MVNRRTPFNGRQLPFRSGSKERKMESGCRPTSFGLTRRREQLTASGEAVNADKPDGPASAFQGCYGPFAGDSTLYCGPFLERPWLAS